MHHDLLMRICLSISLDKAARKSTHLRILLAQISIKNFLDIVSYLMFFVNGLQLLLLAFLFKDLKEETGEADGDLDHVRTVAFVVREQIEGGFGQLVA